MTDLAIALTNSQKAARAGFELASHSLDDTKRAIDQVARTLNGNIRNFKQPCAKTSDIEAQLQSQLKQVVSELNDLQTTSRVDLNTRSQNLDEFSIALFGRTMAGKSTLMEILTNGNGSSIGKGAQRTTRDLRAYHWKGLKVIDVPGIAAFDGDADEELAFKAAAQADLVIFLVTDDAPQPAEAECLARVQALGKPVVKICNVKIALEDADDLHLFLRDPNKNFDFSRLTGITKQFDNFIDLYSPGQRTPFIYTHLRASYLSKQSSYSSLADELAQASRFDRVESHIINQVIKRGQFLRIKSFIDGATVPLLELSDRLLDFSAQNSASGRVLVDKRRQVLTWTDRFRGDGETQINLLITKQISSLRNDIAAFAEDNYERADAGERWSKHVELRGLSHQAQKLQESLQADCQQKLTEFSRELAAELNLVTTLAGDRRFSMPSITDGKRILKWGTTLLSGGLTIAAMILGSGPLGWAAAAVGVAGWLVSCFFDDRELKGHHQKKQLVTWLNKNVQTLENDLRKKLTSWFHDQLLKKQVQALVDDLNTMTNGIFQLADTQRKLAWTLNRQQKALHRKLLKEALATLGKPELNDLVLDVVRIPGQEMTLKVAKGSCFPYQVQADLKSLLGENVSFVTDTKDPASILHQTIHGQCPLRAIRIESKIQVAHIPIRRLNNAGQTRIRLAQQLTELHITQ